MTLGQKQIVQHVYNQRSERKGEPGRKKTEGIMPKFSKSDKKYKLPDSRGPLTPSNINTQIYIHTNAHNQDP